MYPVRYLMLAAMVAALTWFAFELRLLVGADAAIAMIAPIAILTDLWINWNFAAQTLTISSSSRGARSPRGKPGTRQ